MKKDKEEMIEEIEDIAEDIKDNMEEEKEDIDEESTELDELKKELEEKNNRVLRLQADFDNYRKRVEKEKMEIVKFASADLVEKLLPVLDNFDRAVEEEMKNGNEDDGFLEGVKLIQKQLLNVLDTEDVKEIEAINKPFDPNYHNAIQMVESDDHDSNIVTEVFQKGYQMKDRVIRPSMVVVSK
ncbi:MAG: nucleotide exchange factor GrpE [Andreesenia angusta]|nr:nucleotide exchange factor GrpE [Andreesenia angusta]